VASGTGCSRGGSRVQGRWAGARPSGRTLAVQGAPRATERCPRVRARTTASMPSAVASAEWPNARLLVPISTTVSFGDSPCVSPCARRYSCGGRHGEPRAGRAQRERAAHQVFGAIAGDAQSQRVVRSELLRPSGGQLLHTLGARAVAAQALCDAVA
jgi:hypothetical protein